MIIGKNEATVPLKNIGNVYLDKQTKNALTEANIPHKQSTKIKIILRELLGLQDLVFVERLLNEQGYLIVKK